MIIDVQNISYKMALLLPLKQPKPEIKFVEKTFFSQCRKRQVPKNAVKVKKADYERHFHNWKDLGDNKGCSYWKWTETLENKYDSSRLQIGRGDCYEDYLVITYDEEGNAIKIDYTRSSMFRDNYDLYEMLKSTSLQNAQLSGLLEITKLFDIDLNNYKFPMKDISWKHFYKT